MKKISKKAVSHVFRICIVGVVAELMLPLSETIQIISPLN